MTGFLLVETWLSLLLFFLCRLIVVNNQVMNCLVVIIHVLMILLLVDSDVQMSFRRVDSDVRCVTRCPSNRVRSAGLRLEGGGGSAVRDAWTPA